MIGHFTLYNIIGWQIVLVQGPRDRKMGLISNPLDPFAWSDAIGDVLDIPFQWLDAPERESMSWNGLASARPGDGVHRDQSLEAEIGAHC